MGPSTVGPDPAPGHEEERAAGSLRPTYSTRSGRNVTGGRRRGSAARPPISPFCLSAPLLFTSSWSLARPWHIAMGPPPSEYAPAVNWRVSSPKQLEVPMQLLPTLRRPDGGRSLLRDWDRLEDQMQRLLGSMPAWEPTSDPFLWAPRVDFSDENGSFALTAELPGIEPNEVDIEVEGNVITIKGEKKLRREHKDERVQVAERRYGAFERSFTLHP